MAQTNSSCSIIRLKTLLILFGSSDVLFLSLFVSLPQTLTHLAPRGSSQSPSPPTISLGKTRGLLGWRKCFTGSPCGLFPLPGSVPMTCTDTEDVTHPTRLLQRRALAHRAPQDRCRRDYKEECRGATPLPFHSNCNTRNTCELHPSQPERPPPLCQ